MITKISNLFSRFRRDEEGVTLVEYGIALVLAVVVGGTALVNLGGAVSDKMGEAEGCLGIAATGDTCTTAG